MARVFLKRTLAGFAPADETSADTCRRYKVGDIYRADVVKPRSYAFHKLVFALLNLTFANQERYRNFEDFRKAVAMAAGHSREYIGVDGEIWREAGSLSYDALDQAEFDALFPRMMDVCALLLHDMDRAELAAEVERYASEHYGRAA
ncbi:MAG: DUF1367 family protein [Acidobacteria bacterium]|nr:DUF1367 family protein [Acidobacteriota bacterium]